MTKKKKIQKLVHHKELLKFIKRNLNILLNQIYDDKGYLEYQYHKRITRLFSGSKSKIEQCEEEELVAKVEELFAKTQVFAYSDFPWKEREDYKTAKAYQRIRFMFGKVNVRLMLYSKERGYGNR